MLPDAHKRALTLVAFSTRTRTRCTARLQPWRHSRVIPCFRNQVSYTGRQCVHGLSWAALFRALYLTWLTPRKGRPDSVKAGRLMIAQTAVLRAGTGKKKRGGKKKKESDAVPAGRGMAGPILSPSRHGNTSVPAVLWRIPMYVYVCARLG